MDVSLNRVLWIVGFLFAVFIFIIVDPFKVKQHNADVKQVEQVEQTTEKAKEILDNMYEIRDKKGRCFMVFDNQTQYTYTISTITYIPCGNIK